MTKVKLYLLAILIFCLFSAFEINAQIVDKTKIPNLLKEIEKDSVRYIERQAALNFHKLLNIYRVENNLAELPWNETLWLTCRNHNIWMGHNNTLSHGQITGSKYFTGSDPGERYAYASGGKAEQSWSGENVLYNFSYKGKSKDNIALHIAEYSFTQWKNSPGHNQNMLGKDHKIHGAAFFINDGKVWGTSMFARCNNCNTEITIPSEEIQNIEKDLSLVILQEEFKSKSDDSKTLSAKGNSKFNITKFIAELSQNLELSQNKESSKSNRALCKAAQKHAEYLIGAKEKTSIQKKGKSNFYAETTYKRVVKASNGLFMFSKNKNKLQENILIFETDTNVFNLDNILNQTLLMSLIDEQNSAFGYGIAYKKRKKLHQIVIVELSY